MNNLQEDIHLGNLHIDLDRLHQKIGDRWTEIHTFAVDELTILDKNNRVVKIIKMNKAEAFVPKKKEIAK